MIFSDRLFPKRNDDGAAKRWRGPMRMPEPLMWYGDAKTVEPPNSVTFPICSFCRHIIWDWPHFEEPVADNSVCEACFKEEELG